ncbi:hypothetical protein C8J55DRAFT_510373 [Lentinula edodes]|uniref:Uncharacterized protein n=1 Tax=Lentinula lateritia TaxID=40482 RepID=A0A9W9AL62_9AGAR|nr:hypothetical protein C8J55DRAFT_510373 [Lentinula edodes]
MHTRASGLDQPQLSIAQGKVSFSGQVQDLQQFWGPDSIHNPHPRRNEGGQQTRDVLKSCGTSPLFST